MATPREHAEGDQEEQQGQAQLFGDTNAFNFIFSILDNFEISIVSFISAVGFTYFFANLLRDKSCFFTKSKTKSSSNPKPNNSFLKLKTSFFCLLVFIAACYVLIYGKLGVKAYGVAGLGYAFSIQAWLNLLLLVISFYVLPDFKPLQIFAKRNHKGWYYLRQLLQIGWPMSAQFGGELFSFFVISIMVGWLGKTPLAASQVIQQVLLLFLVPMFAVAESTGILVSQSVGAQQYTEIKRIGNVCVALSLVMVIFLGLLFIIFPRYFAAIYMNIHNPANADVLQLIDILFVITAFTLIFDTLRNVSAGALRGLYDTRFAMWAGITANWIVALPLGYILAFPLHMGVVGFRLALTLAVLFGAILVYWRWQRRAKQLVTTEKSALPK